MTSLTVGLVGNPNCGKTTVFNALTGAKQRVGNWPGVTVECKTGEFRWQQNQVNVVDLPGVYSLISLDDNTALDTQIASDYIESGKADLIINILDASNLERNLYLSTQLLEMQVPMIFVLNMMDVAGRCRLQIDVDTLSKKLGFPVIPLVASKGKGINLLKQAIVDSQHTTQHAPQFFPEQIEMAIRMLQNELPQQSRHLALSLLEDDQHALTQVNTKVLAIVKQQQQCIKKVLAEDADILIADHRYGFIHRLVKQTVNQQKACDDKKTSFIDRIVLNRFLGLPVFFVIMYLMFLFAINIGGIFQDFFDIATDTLFVKGLSQLLMTWGMPVWLTAVIASGVGKGINTTLTFIPVIGGMYFFLSFLESSGYMARAAFVMDRIMRALGLPGKSFVPLIVGFGCNVPGIMAARTLECERDRILTILMSPFMSCGARLAIYAVFVSAFFPRGGQNIVFLLYLTGILVAVITGWVLRKTLLQGQSAPFIIEIPPYHLPTLKALSLQTWQRLKRFLLRAGRVIIPVCVLIGTLNSITTDGHLVVGDANQHSLLATLGFYLTPLFSPMGLQQDNWPATVGLITGTLAKEVVIATLNTLYTQVGHLAATTTQHVDVIAGLKAAVWSIVDNIKMLPSMLTNPIKASAPDQAINAGVYGLMYQRFAGQVGAFAYLLFVLLYVPCVSTTAVMIRELNKAWAIFSAVWSIALAYAVAVIYYQLATFSQHPQTSSFWIVSLLSLFGLGIVALRLYGKKHSSPKPTIIPIVAEASL